MIVALQYEFSAQTVPQSRGGLLYFSVMKFIKWLLINGIFSFVIYDATIGITPISDKSANILPFLVALLFSISVLAIGFYLIMHAFYDEMERDKIIELRTKFKRISKAWRIFDATFDMVVTFWLAAFGFTFSAIFYLLHVPILQLGVSLRHNLIDEFEEV